MKKLIITLSLVIMTFVTAQAQTKIAVIDMGKVFENYEKTKINELRLKQQAEVYHEHAVRLNNELNKLKEELKRMIDDAQNLVFSEAERKNRELNARDHSQLVRGKESELQNYNREKQAQLREAYDNMRNEILKEIQKAVQNKCMLEGYSLVLDKSGMSSNGIGLVVFHQPNMEITNEILEDLNRGNRLNAKDPVVAPDKKNTKETITNTNKDSK